MVGTGDTQRRSGEKADRRASRDLIATYHQTQLRALLEHVRAGFAQLDAGEIDEFDLDDLIHRYKRSAAELGRSAGVVNRSGDVTVAPDHDLNRVGARLEHDGKPAAIKAYREALAAASRFHEAMLRPVVERGDSAAQAQLDALRSFEDALRAFADITVPKRNRL